MNPAISETKLPAPRAYALGFPVVSEIFCATSVLALSHGVRPYAIFWAVWSVYLFSFYGMLGEGLWSHVCDKVLATVIPPPPLAHEYATTAVVLVAFGFLVIAARKYVKVCSKFACFFPFPGVPVLESMRSKLLFVDTATRSSPATSELGYRNFRFVSTVTLTLPIVSLFSVFRKLNNGESAEFLPSNIKEFHNQINMIPYLIIQS